LNGFYDISYRIDNIFIAPNTLTQRMPGPKCVGTIKIDVSGMVDGDRCGFSAFNGDSGVLTIENENGQKRLVLTEQKMVLTETKAVSHAEVEEIENISLSTNEVWLRISGDFTYGNDWATFAYSTDGQEWHNIGRPIKMTFDYRRMFMGSKFAIFNYATKALGGYVDVDKFELSQSE